MAQLQAGQQVNRIGKYLYKHIDGAYNMVKSPNMVDIYFIVLYQLKEDLRTEDDHDMHEMSINLNVTTYSNKVRINIIEVSPKEKTIGHDVYYPEKLENLQEAYTLILSKVKRRMEKAFEDYDFLF